MQKADSHLAVAKDYPTVDNGWWPNMLSAEQIVARIAPLVGGDGRASPCRGDEIEETEARLGISLPSDIRDFYRLMNGTADMTTTDHCSVWLWPLEKWTSVSAGAPELANRQLADAILFADHSMWVLGYAAKFYLGRTEIFIVGGGQPMPIAHNFTEFVEMIVTGDERLVGVLANPPLQPDGELDGELLPR